MTAHDRHDLQNICYGVGTGTDEVENWLGRSLKGLEMHRAQHCDPDRDEGIITRQRWRFYG
jgi:hypothetical protein